MERSSTEQAEAPAWPLGGATAVGLDAPGVFAHFLGGVPALALDREAAERAVAVLSAATTLARQTGPAVARPRPADSSGGGTPSWSQRASELERENAHLRQLVVIDSLTGLANRRAYDAGLQREWRRAVRHGTPLSLLLIDIDRFKRYNDAYGHAAGDDCLRRVAAVIGGVARRPGDLAARYGGEEFALVVAETTAAAADKLAAVVRSRVEALGIGHEYSDVAAQVTVSIGVATTTPRREHTPTALVATADRALYAAKQDGRNRVHPAVEREAQPTSGDSDAPQATDAGAAAPVRSPEREGRAHTLAWLRQARRGE